MNHAFHKVFPPAWSTADEFRFLDRLGSNGIKGLTRRELLLKYLATAKKRADWDRVDAERAIQHARDLLRVS